MPETINQKINRRTYLQYTSAFIGGAAIGALATYASGHYGWIPGLTKTVTQRLTQTLTERVTETTTVKLASFEGILIFDKNGNGIRDVDEPVAPNTKVQVKDNNSKIIADAITDSAGKYKLEDVEMDPTGSYKLYVNDENFRYMCRSIEEFKPILEGYDILLNKDEEMIIGLINGPITLPFKRNTSFRVHNYVDLDPSSCPPGAEPHNLNHDCPNIRDWKGGQQTYDDHTGIDYVVPTDTPILACAPGIVLEAGFDSRGGGKYVIIDHGYSIKSDYYHLNSYDVSVGQKVSRGENIASSGNTGNSSEPHLHFQIDINDVATDPYRDLLNPKSLSLWTVDNEPQFP